MYVEITSTRMIEIDDSDDAGLARLTALLDRHNIQGDNLAEKVEELSRYDDHDALDAIVTAYRDESDADHSVTDYEVDGLWPEDEDEDEEEEETDTGYVDALNLPAWVQPLT